MAKKSKRPVREPRPPELRGVVGATVYFFFDPYDEREKLKRVQDYPELYSSVLKLCIDYFTNAERKETAHV